MLDYFESARVCSTFLALTASSGLRLSCSSNVHRHQSSEFFKCALVIRNMWSCLLACWSFWTLLLAYSEHHEPVFPCLDNSNLNRRMFRMFRQHVHVFDRRVGVFWPLLLSRFLLFVCRVRYLEARATCLHGVLPMYHGGTKSVRTYSLWSVEWWVLCGTGFMGTKIS